MSDDPDAAHEWLAARAALRIVTGVLVAFALVLVAWVAAAQAAPPAPPPPHKVPGSIVIPAARYTNGVGPLMIGTAVDPGEDDYGVGVLMMNNPKGLAEGPFGAQFRFRSDKPGRYMLWVEYAGDTTVRTEISFNGTVVQGIGLIGQTDCYLVRCQKWFEEVEVQVRSGSNTINLANKLSFPHIRALALVPVAKP